MCNPVRQPFIRAIELKRRTVQSQSKFGLALLKALEGMAMGTSDIQSAGVPIRSACESVSVALSSDY